MDGALDGARHARFSTPDPSVVAGINEAVPDVRGMDPDAATQRLAESGFGAFVAGEVASAIAKGLVVETDPPPGANVAAGSDIGLFVSNGQPGQVPTPPDPGDRGRGRPVIPPPPT
jgi:PASTA domain